MCRSAWLNIRTIDMLLVHMTARMNTMPMPLRIVNFSLMRYKAISMTLLYLCVDVIFVDFFCLPFPFITLPFFLCLSHFLFTDFIHLCGTMPIVATVLHEPKTTENE